MTAFAHLLESTINKSNKSYRQLEREINISKSVIARAAQDRSISITNFLGLLYWLKNYNLMTWDEIMKKILEI